MAAWRQQLSHLQEAVDMSMEVCPVGHGRGEGGGRRMEGGGWRAERGGVKGECL